MILRILLPLHLAPKIVEVNDLVFHPEFSQAKSKQFKRCKLIVC